MNFIVCLIVIDCLKVAHKWALFNNMCVIITILSALRPTATVSDCLESLTFPDERAARAAARAMSAARRVTSVVPQCSAGAHVRTTLLLRPHARASDLYLLAYYETGQRARPHRLLRHVFRFKPIVGTFFHIFHLHFNVFAIIFLHTPISFSILSSFDKVMM